MPWFESRHPSRKLKTMDDMFVFSGRSNPQFAENVARAIGQPLGHNSIQTFSDGEIWVKYNDNIRGSDVYIIQSTNPPAENLMELLILLDAAKRSSARRVTAVIPYFGYARQDRKDQPRVAISAKLVANLITTAGADRVITMDLHTAQIQGFFDIPFDHLYASGILVKTIEDMKMKNLAVVAPDVGGIKIARAYAKRLEADLVLIDKRRPRANVAEMMNIIGDVKDKNIIIIDDLIDTAGTFTNAVVALKQAGAKEIYGACTHPILSGHAYEKIDSCEITRLFVTDTVPLRYQTPKIKIISVAEIFGEAIKRTNLNQSISSLFDIDKDKTK